MEVLSLSTKQTEELARKVAAELKPGNILLLRGDLGSGKTTFTSFLVKALGIDARVQSPTFVIMRKYSGGTGDIKVVNHIDLYRLTSIEEVEDLGLSEIVLESDSITIVEWPDVASTFFSEIDTKNLIKIDFEYQDEGVRKITSSKRF
jgi:tRNA threonylcarbamoyladenosine biosynthesis protein TsaE